MHAAPSPDGPWRRIAPICGNCDNAAPVFLPNGSLVVVYDDCASGASSTDCPAAPNGTDSKTNETVIIWAPEFGGQHRFPPPEKTELVPLYSNGVYIS